MHCSLFCLPGYCRNPDGPQVEAFTGYPLSPLDQPVCTLLCLPLCPTDWRLPANSGSLDLRLLVGHCKGLTWDERERTGYLFPIPFPHSFVLLTVPAKFTSSSAPAGQQLSTDCGHHVSSLPSLGLGSSQPFCVANLWVFPHPAGSALSQSTFINISSPKTFNRVIHFPPWPWPDLYKVSPLWSGWSQEGTH